MYKLKVFISSAVDKEGVNLFSKMRKRVKDELENMGIFNVYIYEEGFGTSKNVVDDYLDEIADSHVCLVSPKYKKRTFRYAQLLAISLDVLQGKWLFCTCRLNVFGPRHVIF